MGGVLRRMFKNPNPGMLISNPAMPSNKNRLYYGDNLQVLREYIPDQSVDLIYFHPPSAPARTTISGGFIVICGQSRESAIRFSTPNP